MGLNLSDISLWRFNDIWILVGAVLEGNIFSRRPQNTGQNYQSTTPTFQKRPPPYNCLQDLITTACCCSNQRLWGMQFPLAFGFWTFLRGRIRPLEQTLQSPVRGSSSTSGGGLKGPPQPRQETDRLISLYSRTVVVFCCI